MEFLKEGALAFGWHLSGQQLQAFQTYAQELGKWARDINLTRITEAEEIQIKHFLDSLTCLVGLGRDLEGKNLIDIGSGAGFPGLPLKIFEPSLKVTLLEATGKKTEFLRHMVKTLDLKGVEVINARAEDLGRNPQYRGRYDFVVARAVAEMPSLVELALPLARITGTFVAMKGPKAWAEMAAAKKAVKELGGATREIRTLTLPFVYEKRALIIIDKAWPSPDRYPRRAGIPVKRPISSQEAARTI